jgi:hypothetical protein
VPGSRFRAFLWSGLAGRGQGPGTRGSGDAGQAGTGSFPQPGEDLGKGGPTDPETADRSVRCNAVILVSGNTEAYYFDNGIDHSASASPWRAHEGSLMSRNRPTVVLAVRHVRLADGPWHRAPPTPGDIDRGCRSQCPRAQTNARRESPPPRVSTVFEAQDSSKIAARAYLLECHSLELISRRTFSENRSV